MRLRTQASSSLSKTMKPIMGKRRVISNDYLLRSGGKVKATPDIKAEILQKVQREGMTVREAMRVYGVSQATIYGWLNRQAREQNTYLIVEVDRLKKELDEAHRIIGVLTTETLRQGEQVSSEKQKESIIRSSEWNQQM